jgi:hypothetical protein
MENFPWHVAEFAAREAAGALLSLEDRGYAYFYPRWVTNSMRLGRSMERLVPLSPRLMFVRFDADDPHEWHAVRDCFRDGFRGFFGGERPLDVPERAFDPLHILYGADARGLMPAPAQEVARVDLCVGDRVRILAALAAANNEGDSVAVIGRVIWSDVRGAKVVYQMLGREVEGYFPHSSRILDKIGKSEENLLLTPYLGKKKRLLRIVDPLSARRFPTSHPRG